MTSSAPVTPQDSISAGFAFDAAGAIKVIDAAPQSFANGFGFYAGALCTSSGPTASYNSGLPFTADGRLVTDPAGAIIGFESGAPVTSTGIAVSTGGLPPVASFELREDGGFELREDGGKERREG